MTKSEKVLIDGVVLPFQEKAPYKTSGHSIEGAFEYDEANDKIKCHECGGWFCSLNSHLQRTEGMTFEKYKKKHGLLPRTVTISEGYRARMIARGIAEWERNKTRLKPFHKGEHGSGRPSKYPGGHRNKAVKKRGRYKFVPMEELNKKKLCPEQVLDVVKKTAVQVGRTPTGPELYEAGLDKGGLLYFYGGLENVMRLANMPHRPSGREGLVRNSRERLLEFLVNFKKVHGRNPSFSDTRRRMIPGSGQYLNRFGTWNAALKAAGLSGIHTVHSGWPDKALLRVLKKACDEKGSAISSFEWFQIAKKNNWPSIRPYLDRFGTWVKALARVGYQPMSPAEQMTKWNLSKKIPKEKLLRDFADYRKKLGRHPTTREWNETRRERNAACAATYFLRFGPWSKLGKK